MVPNDKTKECVNATDDEDEWCEWEVNKPQGFIYLFSARKNFFLLFFYLLKRRNNLPLLCSTSQARSPRLTNFATQAYHLTFSSFGKTNPGLS